MTKPDFAALAVDLDSRRRAAAQPVCGRHPDSVLDAAGRCLDCERERDAEHDRGRWLGDLDRQWHDRVPRRFQAATTTHPELLAWARQCAADPHAAPGLLLLGPTGVGKTHAAYGAMRAALTRRRVTWHATTATEMLANLRPSANTDTEAVMRLHRDATVLLLDDLGISKNSEWVEETTYRVLNARYEQMRPTVITSNLALADLGAAVGDRVASRLSETCLHVVLDGPDRRRET